MSYPQKIQWEILKKKEFNLDSNCSGVDLKRIKKVGNLLGVPYSFLDKVEDFNELVIEKVACFTFSMQKKIPCFSCHKIMFLAFESVREKIGADFISTGHYARFKEIKAQG